MGGPTWTENEIGPAVTAGLGHVIRARDDGVLGFMIVDEVADPQFWRPADLPATALYVHHLVVGRAWAGQGVGARLLAHARVIAAASGRTWLRLDAPRDAERLHRYYRDRGFTHLRTERVPGRGSGALFQMPAGAGPRQSRVDTKMQNGCPAGSA